jgi:hypothetical protein
MSWGDDQYMHYCRKVAKDISEGDGSLLKDIINKRWKYVSAHANLEKLDFEKDVIEEYAKHNKKKQKVK